MSKSGIRLICLDLGGVLVRVCSGWDEACRLTRLSLPKSLKEPAVVSEVTRLSRLHETGRIDDHTFDREVANITGLTPAQVAAASAAWLPERFPGAVELVEHLAAIPGLRTACLSNTNARHWRMMSTPGEPVGLPLHRLTWRLTSFEIGVMKPDPGIYVHVEQATGIAPQEIVFFDDSRPNIEAARARGWQAHLIDPSTGDSPAQVRRALADLITG